jgi:hypothetical protein
MADRAITSAEPSGHFGGLLDAHKVEIPLCSVRPTAISIRGDYPTLSEAIIRLIAQLGADNFGEITRGKYPSASRNGLSQSEPSVAHKAPLMSCCSP